MRAVYKFDELVQQRDAFVIAMDMLHYGMYDDDLQLGPFSITEFSKGFWVQGDLASLGEFVGDFEPEVNRRKWAYKKSMVNEAILSG